MTTEYRVILSRKENNEIPIITPCTIYERHYNKIMEIIGEAQKELTRGRNAGKKYLK